MANRFAKLINNAGTLAAVLGVGSIALGSCTYLVDGGERALIFDRTVGVKPNAIGEGMHFFIPWLQKPIIYDIRATPQRISTETGSKDLQTVNITLRVLHRPDVSHLKDIYVNLGLDYSEQVLPSIANEIMKAVVAQFDAGELITQREEVSLRIREQLITRASQFNILLDDVSITHLTFSPEYTAAVEQKQVEQQHAERQKFLVDKAQQETMAQVILAEGETEAARLIMEAMQSGNEFVRLRKIEAAREIVSTLSERDNIVYLPNSSNMLISDSPSRFPLRMEQQQKK